VPIAAQLLPQIEQFIHDNPQGVLTSFRRNGMPQLSIVTVYPRDGGVGISITETRMKFKNLLRDPRCSVLISHADWWSGFGFEGRRSLTTRQHRPRDTPHGAPTHLSATTRRRSADWDEYDRIANEDKRRAAAAARPRTAPPWPARGCAEQAPAGCCRLPVQLRARRPREAYLR
jgi:hypothetical protein